MTEGRVPGGITLLAPGGDDARLAEIGRVFHADTKLPMGALKLPQPPLTQATNAPASGEIAVAVVGAHLSGLPLNGELSSLGGRLLEATKPRRTTDSMRSTAQSRRSPACCASIAARGAAIEVEVWALPLDAFGRFVDGIPSPLSIGTLSLSDGRGATIFASASTSLRTPVELSVA